MQATSSPTPALAPAVPATITITNADGTTQTLTVPTTRREVQALRQERSELSDQLESAAGRRHSLSEELKTAPAGPSRTGLEQRITVLDKRMVQLESDIAATGRQMTAAPLALVGGSESTAASNDIPDNAAAMGGAFIGLVLFPLTFVLARNLWKRGSRAAAVPLQQLSGEATQRLERLEQGMEAIAIEIERVAEGQRFVTRILSEGQATRLPLNAPQLEDTRVQAST
ncbi:MAG: hypothetical protein ACRD3J_08910 [Thermoanaerobaculia bacterium]